MRVTNWKEWALEARSAWRDAQPQDQDGGGKPDRWNAMRADLLAALSSDPLCFGIRPGANMAAALKAAADVADGPAALEELRARLADGVAPRYSWRQAGSSPPTARDWLVHNWLPAGRAGMLVGAGGTGKSKLALQLACGVASGHGKWLPGGDSDTADDMPSAPQKQQVVVIASWEDETDEAERRLYWMAHEDGGNLPWAWGDQLEDRLHWLDIRSRGPLWGPIEDGSRHVATRGALTPAGRRLRHYCESVKARLLVLDPVAAAYGSDENVRALVRQFMADWDAWAQGADCAVMLIAHPPKSAADYSGSTDWQGASRWLWTVKKTALPDPTALGSRVPARKGVKLTLEKSNYSLAGKDLWMRIRGRGDGWEVCSAKESAEAVERPAGQNNVEENEAYDEGPIF